jgi:hypothetical protein
MLDAAERQQLPTGDGQDVASEVIHFIRTGIGGYTIVPPDLVEHLVQDIGSRVNSGEKKYGVRLKTNNGRNATLDAYQEILDFLNYSIQGYLERKEGFLELFEGALSIAITVKLMLLEQETKVQL